MTQLQQELQEKFEAIEAKIKELESLKNEKYKTSCQFRYNPSNSYSTLNINSTLNIEELIHANAFIQYKNDQYQESARQLELNSFPVFTWCGYTSDLWLNDIKLRLKLITMETELNKLRGLRSKIQPFLPEENKIKQLLIELESNK